jgi:hypothetical protein
MSANLDLTRRLWARMAVAWQRPATLELSDRTLDDIGAPDWLRAQAHVERDDAWFGAVPWV